MSAQLTIRFGADPGEASLAPLTLELVDAGLDVRRLGVYHIQDTPTIAVEPGHYLVRGQLPSGEWLSAQTNVNENSIAEITLSPQRASPHEHLAWGYYMHVNPWLEDPNASRRARAESLLAQFAPSPVTYRVWRHTIGQPWAQLAAGTVGLGIDGRVEVLALKMFHLIESSLACYSHCITGACGQGSNALTR